MLKILCLLIAGLILSCDNDIYRPLTGGYYYVSLGGINSVITFPDKSDKVIIPCSVISYNYDKNYIVVKQKYIENCAWPVPEKLKEKIAAIQYWIITVSNKQVHGPLTKEEYLNYIDGLNIPSNLKLSD